MGSNLVSLIRNLQQRKGRKRHGLALAEGARLVEDAIAAGLRVEGAVVTTEFGASARGGALVASLASHAVTVEEIPARELERLAETDTPQGVIAVIEPPAFAPDTIRPTRGRPVLVLDAVQDPGNVGTLLRTALAMGAAGAILLPGTADVSNSKVIRSAMGATFRLPEVSMDEPELHRWTAEHDVILWVAAAQGTPLERLAPPERLGLVVGNEGAGVRQSLVSLARNQVAIPLAAGVESLNVAVAAGILLYEVRRAS